MHLFFWMSVADNPKASVHEWHASPARVQHKLVGKTKLAAGAGIQWKDPCVLPDSNSYI